MRRGPWSATQPSSGVDEFPGGSQTTVSCLFIVQIARRAQHVAVPRSRRSQRYAPSSGRDVAERQMLLFVSGVVSLPDVLALPGDTPVTRHAPKPAIAASRCQRLPESPGRSPFFLFSLFMSKRESESAPSQHARSFRQPVRIGGGTHPSHNDRLEVRFQSCVFRARTAASNRCRACPIWRPLRSTPPPGPQHLHHTSECDCAPSSPSVAVTRLHAVESGPLLKGTGRTWSRAPQGAEEPPAFRGRLSGLEMSDPGYHRSVTAYPHEHERVRMSDWFMSYWSGASEVLMTAQPRPTVPASPMPSMASSTWPLTCAGRGATPPTSYGDRWPLKCGK